MNSTKRRRRTATAASVVLAVVMLMVAARASAAGFCSGGECTTGDNPEAAWARSVVATPPKSELSPPLPRVHVDELREPENEQYRRRVRPFILTGAMDDWGLMSSWNVTAADVAGGRDHLSRYFAREVCDFYPYNMLLQGTHPYLIRFGAGMKELMLPPGRYTEPPPTHTEYACEGGCRYLHLQFTPKTWAKLEDTGDLPKKRHAHTKGDQWWMRRCMKDESLQEEYHLKLHWKIALFGTAGSGMFEHKDSLASSSWHAHVQNRKWWRVCSPDGRECMESVLHPGEILYYGPMWEHTTRNLGDDGKTGVSSTITGTVATRSNFEGLADKLHSECSANTLNFRLSGKLCDALDGCYRTWHRVLAGKDAPKNRWKPWRDIASAELQRERDARRPQDNNYDGRNYIAE